MATFDQMIIDDRDLANRYFGENNFDDFDDDQYLLTNNQQPFHSNPLTKQNSLTRNDDDDNLGLFGRRVYLESPALGNKEEEDLYRYVPSRLSDHAANVIGPSVPAPTGGTLMDSLDFELDLLGAANTRPAIPYRTNPQLFQESKPPAPLTQITNPLTPMTNMRRADPRQDPLLGPLLAELDAMSTKQQRLSQAPPPSLPSPPPVYRRNSVPYESNLTRPPGLSQPNHTLPAAANRTLNDALLEAELYDSLEPRDQQIQPVQQHQSNRSSAPSIKSLNHSQQQQPPPPPQQKQQQQLPIRQSNMNSTDVFMPSSYNTEPAAFLNNFGPDDQLFQQPMLNAIGQNYVPKTRQPPPPPQQQQQKQQPQYEQREMTFDNSHTRMSPSQHSVHVPLQQPPINDNPYQQQDNSPPTPPLNRQIPYVDNKDPFSEYHQMFAPSQYQRPSPAPSQQRPPFSQQQRTVPLPPLPPQQQKYQRSLPPSHQQSQHFEEQRQPDNQEMFFTDHNDDQLDQFSYQQLPSQQPPPPPMSNSRNVDQQNDQDSRRQAVWNELQRTNAKVQEKNAKKRESANRREQILKGNYNSNNAWGSGSQQSSAQSKTNGQSPLQRRRPPAVPVSKTNYIDENIDMIKNKENFYHRYPAKKYENLYTKRKDLQGEGNNDRKTDPNQDPRLNFNQTQSSTAINNAIATYPNSQHRASLPITINLNPAENSQNGNHQGSVAVPLDSHVTRTGDKISVNIDLRLVDLQHLKQQQQNSDHPDWSGLDPLDRHIRKLERSIDQTLPQTNSPTQRSPTLTNPNLNTSMGRYGKNTTGAGRGGYSPPNYTKEYYNYGDRGQEDSYLAKMNHVKQGPHFKPYTGQDYEQFKKNYGFGGGYLGFDFDNPNFKEKSDKLSKTKEYAQQVENRNKKKLAEAPRRTLSDTRVPTDVSKTQRALEYARVSTRHKPLSGTSTHSNPPETNGAVPLLRRPTEVPHLASPMRKQPSKLLQNDDNELVERLAMRHERDKAQVQGILNPSQKRREVVFDTDDRRGSEIERMAQDRANQRRLSPPKQLPPTGPTNSGNVRRPLRFDKPLVPDESTYQPSSAPQQQLFHHVRQPDHQPQTNVDELANRHNDEKMLMEAIRQELSERPLAEDEELVVVEQ